MKYRKVDRNNWKRKEYFEHYLTAVPCTYSISVRLDITKIKQKGLRLYPTMIFYLTKIVNKNEPFRTAFRENGELVIYESMSPSYTIFHQDTETFSSIWTEYTDEYDLFCQQYEQDLREYGDVNKMIAKPGIPENSFTISMLPWTAFEGFNLNTSHFNYLIPIFTLGKYYETNGKHLIPLAVQVHHAVCDGYHTGKFIDELQRELLNV